jgi:hypothetical protein
VRINFSAAYVFRLVPLHRGFDGLVVSLAYDRQRLRVDQHLDAPCDAECASDQAGALKREHHLMDRGRTDGEVALQVGFGRRLAEHRV